MAMTAAGRKGGAMAEINMTPMIDVLLVLLIIFMVVQTGLRRGLQAVVPPPAAAETTAPQIDQIVLEVERGGGYRLNQQSVAAGGLEAHLRGVFAARPRKVLFVKGAENASYGEVVVALDAAQAAGIEVTGLVPRASAP